MLIACVTMFFFFNDTATTEIYTLSLHDALPIFQARTAELQDLARISEEERGRLRAILESIPEAVLVVDSTGRMVDRKSTRLNSSHANISYAVFCLKKKKPTHDK